VSFPRFLHVVIRKWNTTLQTSVNGRPTFVNQISSQCENFVTQVLLFC
jgi:hypothetical protein